MIRRACPAPREINLKLPLRIRYAGVLHGTDQFVVYDKRRLVDGGDKDTALAVYRARERELNALYCFNAPNSTNEA